MLEWFLRNGMPRGLTWGVAVLALEGVCAAAAAAGPPTTPELPEGVLLVPYVYAGTAYDSNLFRVADDGEAAAQLGTTDTDELISRMGGGIKARVPVSLQTLRFDGWLERVDFDTFGRLDHNAGDAEAAWDWEIGRLWSGTLSGRYRREMARFEEFESVAGDIKTFRDVAFDAAFRFLPDWALAAGSRYRQTDHRERDYLDRTENTYFAELSYFSATRTRLGLRGSITEADFDQPEPLAGGGELVNDYIETALDLVAGWEGTRQSRLEARVGYTERAHDERPARDFEGVAARADYLWRATAKTSLRLALWRELKSLDGEVATFVEARGLQLAPQWDATPRLRLRGSVTAENRQFDGASGTASANAGREDQVRSASLAADYELLRSLRFTIEAAMEERESNREDKEYRYEQIFAGVAYGF